MISSCLISKGKGNPAGIERSYFSGGRVSTIRVDGATTSKPGWDKISFSSFEPDGVVGEAVISERFI